MASAVAAPISTDEIATRATAVTTSREVSERGRPIRITPPAAGRRAAASIARDEPRASSRSPSLTRLQHVAGAAHGVDHRRPAGVDLLAQVGDIELDHVGLAPEVVVPHPVEDLGLAQHPARVAHQEAEQLEL